MSTPAGNLNPTLSRFVLGIVGILTFIVVTALFAAMAKLVAPHSDGAGPVLYAQAILDGNVGLRGWDLTTVGFYTELPFYVFAVKLFGVQADVMRYVPALIYALNVVLIFALIWKYRISERMWIFLPPIIYLVLPANGIWPHALTPALHHVTATIGYGILLILNDKLVAEKSMGRWAALAALAALATWGDLAFLFLFVLPIALAGFLLYLKDTAARSLFAFNTLAPICVGAVLGHAMVLAMRATGMGAPVGLGGMLFESKQNISVKAETLLDSWVRFFGVEFWDKPLSLLTLSMLVMGIGALVWLAACVRALRHRDSGIDLICVTVPVVTVLATVFSNRGDFLDDTRFLVPSFFLAMLLISRHWQRNIAHAAWKLLPAGLLVAALYLSSWFLKTNGFLLAGDAYASDLKRVVAHLESKGLSKGFGDFWACQVLRVVGKGKLEVIPVGIEGDSRIVARRWSAHSNWFQDAVGRFAVFQGENDEDKERFVSFAITAWGHPIELSEVGQIVILIWHKDLTIGN